MKSKVFRHNFRRGPSKEYHFGQQTKAWQKCIVALYVIQITTDPYFIHLNVILKSFLKLDIRNLRKYPETNKNITLHMIKGNNNGTALIQYLKINLDLYFIYWNVIIKYKSEWVWETEPQIQFWKLTTQGHILHLDKIWFYSVQWYWRRFLSQFVFNTCIPQHSQFHEFL